jgi:hypothetical protein
MLGGVDAAHGLTSPFYGWGGMGGSCFVWSPHYEVG